MRCVRILLFALLIAAGLSTGHAADPVDPPPPVDLDQPSGIGRAQITSLLDPQKAFALVIGIDSFDNAAWRRLEGVKAETDAVAKALDVHGFAVTRPASSRLTARDLQRELQRFLQAHERFPDHRLIVYIASHGLAVSDEAQARDAAGRPGDTIGYVIASDTPASGDPAFASRALPVTEIARLISTVGARHLLLAFNTCFSGALVPKSRAEAAVTRHAARPVAPPLAAEVADWVDTLVSRQAHLVMTAGDDSQTVPDADSPFGRAFVEGLYGAADRDGDGLILAAELAQYVRARVAQETRLAKRPNDPVFAVLPNARGDSSPAGGDFVFLSPRGPAGAEIRLDTQALERRRSTLAGGQFTDCIDCPVMVDLSDVKDDKGPVRPFALGRTEVTSAEWSACFRQGFCRRWKPETLGGDRPVAGITWADKIDFLAWLNAQDRPGGKCRAYRLPSPAEWRVAAMGGANTRYPWGEAPLPDRANCADCGSPWDGREPAPAGRFPPNAYGLHDMIGNLWEWVETADAKCESTDLANGACAPGMVLGGAFSTKAAAISLRPEAATGRLSGGSVPRPGGRGGLKDPGWPTIGMRVACDLDDAAGQRPN